jgi:hypothetical protein
LCTHSPTTPLGHLTAFPTPGVLYSGNFRWVKIPEVREATPLHEAAIKQA